jgi:hypothetical protein
MFFLCSILAMTYIPLYPYDLDPYRILSPRRIREEFPATPPPEPDPPDPPPPGGTEGLPEAARTHPQGGGGASSNIPDAAYWPNHPGSAPDQQPAGPAKVSPAPEPDPAPESHESERIRLMRAWIDKHWDFVEAMARADETPQRPAPPPERDTAESLPPPPPVHVRKGDRWNKPKMAEFLRQLAATQSVSAAASSVGMTRSSAYRLRNRLKGQPFDIAWEVAFRHGYDNLAHSALELALEGEEVPHYYQGELKSTHRKRNPQLIVQLLKMRNRVGVPMLGRFGAAAEYWGEHWDQLLERVGTGPVDWSAEQRALGEDERKRLELPDADRDLALLIARNTPDERGGGSGS